MTVTREDLVERYGRPMPADIGASGAIGAFDDWDKPIHLFREDMRRADQVAYDRILREEEAEREAQYEEWDREHARKRAEALAAATVDELLDDAILEDDYGNDNADVIAELRRRLA